MKIINVQKKTIHERCMCTECDDVPHKNDALEHEQYVIRV